MKNTNESKNNKNQKNSKKIPLEINKIKSIEEETYEKKISSIEKIRLNRVFEILCASKDYFNAKDISRVLNFLEYPMNKQEIDLLIWVRIFSFILNILFY